MEAFRTPLTGALSLAALASALLCAVHGETGPRGLPELHPAAVAAAPERPAAALLPLAAR